jgi:TnpA family transposase
MSTPVAASVKHWPDLLRAGISIREGRLSSVTLLRRPGNHSRRNRLYKAYAASRQPTLTYRTVS